jgi:hypothetical protein
MIGLDDKITIVPVGGLDNIATFVALLSGNRLDFTILHDYDGKSPQNIENLVKRKLIKNSKILNYAMFRNGQYSGESSSYLELMRKTSLKESFYLSLFNDTFEQQKKKLKLLKVI